MVLSVKKERMRQMKTKKCILQINLPLQRKSGSYIPCRSLDKMAQQPSLWRYPSSVGNTACLMLTCSGHRHRGDKGLGVKMTIGMLPSLEVTSLPRTELSSIFPGRGKQPSESCSFHSLYSSSSHTAQPGRPPCAARGLFRSRHRILGC